MTTLFEKIWHAHVIERLDAGRDLIYVDRHVLQETTCAVAFENLRRRGRRVRRPELTIATEDHIVPTRPGRGAVADDAEGQELLDLMRANAAGAGIRRYGLGDPRQGIVHVISAELGLALPGTVLACGDSHTSTVGGLGALGLGIGTSEVEHVLATQTLALDRPRTMRITFEGRTAPGVTAKDMILHAIGRFGIAAGRGHAVEYAGPAVRALPVEQRLTLCNMSIEIGARVGFIAPDDTVFDYVAGRPFAPKGAAFDRLLDQWRSLVSDPDAVFDRDLALDASAIEPQVTWGTMPEQVAGIGGRVPDPARLDPSRRAAAERALAYMDLVPDTPLEGLPVDVVFIGSCTNSRLSDLKAAAALVRGRRVAPGVRALVVPGSEAVRRAGEGLGLDRVFTEAGFEWREPGCSMCLGMNGDVVPPGRRSVSTSNRNFEGRQGPGSRTHLASPLTAAASAIAGRIADPRKLMAV